MGLTPVYMCVHVPDFAAQAMLRLRPELQKQAVAVVAGDPPLEVVCSTNRRAAQDGVAPGMTRAELDACIGVCVLRQSAAEERTARSALMEAASAFTYRMEVQPARAAALDVVLDMTGTERLFGPADECAARIVRALGELKIVARLAVSANLHTAVCLASTARTPRVVPQGAECAALRRLPLSALPLTPDQAGKLGLWGLRTLGELADLPEAELVSRMGQAGRRLRLLAMGAHPHLMVPEESDFALAEFVAFDAPVELLDPLMQVSAAMLDQLLVRAGLQALALASIMITLGLDGGGEHARIIKPAVPLTQGAMLLKLLQLDLQANPPPAAVVSILLQAEPGKRSTVQAGLFAPQTPEPMQLDVALARIGALVGEDRVGRARLTDTHAAESFVMERFRVPAAAATAVAASPQDSPATSVALRCLRPPVPLRMQFRDTLPCAFFYEGRRYAIHELQGPWRRSGEWWSAAVWSFDEWDASAAAASGDTLLCVLAHDLLRHEWQLKALYD